MINKTIYKQINYNGTYDSNSYEIISWNNKYSIFGCYKSFVIINIQEGKMVKKIDIDGYITGVKKIKV